MAKYYIHRNELNEILFLSEIYEGTLKLEKDSLVVIKGVSGYSSIKIHFVYETTLNKNYIINDIVYTINEIWPTCTDSCYKVILLDNDKQKSLLIGLDIIDDTLLSTILNTQNIEEKIKEKKYSYHDSYYHEIYDKEINVGSLVKIRSDDSVIGILIGSDPDDEENVLVQMTETGICKTYHRNHVYPVAHKVLKYKNHNTDKHYSREVPYQKEKFYTHTEMMKDLFYELNKSQECDYIVKGSSDDLLFSKEHTMFSYPENTSNETLFSVRNDGKIFSNIENKGYHLKDIKKGTLGNISKIEEELEELKDAIEQDCKIMTMVELSDLYGAISAYAETQGLKMEDLEKFSNITKRAFKNGYRN